MMRLSVSNLAWPSASDDQAFALLAREGVQGVEVAPTRLAAWADITPAVLNSFGTRLRDAGLTVSSLQALLFGSEHELWLAGIVAGLAYGWLYRRCGQLWPAIAAHALTNAVLGLWVLQGAHWAYW